MQDKTLKTLLLVAVLVLGAYILWRLYQNWKANGGSFGGTFGQLGTNLNSIAPELVGGSQGPQAGPGVNMPVNITLTETTNSQEPPPQAMVPAGQSADNPLGMQSPNALTMANPTTGSSSTNNYEDNSYSVTGNTPLIKQTPGGNGNGGGSKKDDDDKKKKKDKDK
jgi:hypothetical protein